MNARLRTCLLAAVLLAWTSSASPDADANHPPRVSIPEMKAMPSIDGVIDAVEWRDAVGSCGLVNNSAPLRVSDREAFFWVGRGGTTLLIAIRTEAPPGGELLTRARPDGDRDMRDAFLDDSIELVIDPKRGRPAGDRHFYHIIFNATGALYDRSFNPDNPANPVAFSWRLPAWEMKNTVHDGWWDVEMAIPFSSLGAGAADLKSPWGLRIARDWKRPFMQSQWNTVSGAYEDQSTIPVVVWDDAAPVVRVLSLREKGVSDRSAVRLSVRNPHAVPVAVAVQLRDAWHSDQHRVLQKTVTLQPGAEEIFEVSAPDGGPSGEHRTLIRVADPRDGRVHYLREFNWTMHRPESVWEIGKKEVRKVDLKFKYYPYHNKVRVLVNAAALDGARVAGGEAEIVRLEGTGAGARPGRRFWNGRLAVTKTGAETTADIPDLPDGEYRLSVRLEGEGVPAAPVTQDFVRKHFPWERNTLGTSDRVIPPFAPMGGSGTDVTCILRRLSHGESGLWKSVVSDGEELLAGPMRWEVALADGSKPRVEGGGWKAVSRKETAVEGRADWRAGPLSASLRTECEYDGMMKCTLRLSPTSASIAGLALRIPLADGAAAYMHACGDGLRHNYAGRTPAGDGRVWDSSKGNRIDIVGTFYPYVWLGDGERGLCWFADTDRDWILDDATPTVDLVREKGALWLNVRFITKPGPLAREHTIVFGLQATPTKPMPDGWRRWTLNKQIPGGRPVRVVGHSMYWGAEYYLPYPLERDFSYFAETKRLREAGATDPANAEFTKKWMEKVAKYYPEKSEDYGKNRASINAGMWVFWHTPWKDGWRCFGYTNARGIHFLTEEFATFLDEWLNYPFFSRDYDRTSRVAYDVTPSESMVDMLLWYYRESLAAFDGVYWDNTYLSARNDPVVGDAWTDGNGRVHPGLGLFALRELVKRTAVLFAGEGKKLQSGRVPLITMPHMTNTMLVPVLSFSNAMLDWEWKYGFDDFQDRFTPELTVAQTIGRQVGAWPTILAGGHFKPETAAANKRVFRTRLGVCLVHEISHWDFQPADDIALYTRLFEFGYGLPGCRVWNYWRKGHPVSVAGADADVKTLVISKPGAALVVATGYGAGGACRIKLDAAALGLSAGASATDFETGAPIARTGPGEFEVEIRRHDFRILHVRNP